MTSIFHKMNAFKNILNKLYSEDNGVFAVLKAENKLELAAIDDLDNALDQAEQISDIADVEVLLNAEEKADELINLKSELDNKSQDFSTEFQSLDADFSELKDKIDLLEARLNAYQELSDELGIDPNNSESYNYGDLLLFDMQETYRKYDQSFNIINSAFEIAE